MKTSLVSMEALQTDLLSRPAVRTSKLFVVGPWVQILRGREAISAKHEMLEALCERTGQAGAMHWLNYQMSKPTEAKKIPTLLLMGMDAGVSPGEAAADDILGAVMLYEYKLAGRGLKLFATDDMTGQGTVIAPADQRTEVAEAACERLMELGALAVLITLAPAVERWEEANLGGSSVAPFAMARQVRSVPLSLSLAETLEETLASLGRHTRRNLRYYRRRLETEMGAEFVARAEMSRAEFLALNRTSINPVPRALAGWRYDVAREGSGMMLAGVREANGQWLSLIGGRRHGRMTEIDWQMNRAGLPRYSLSTVMRSYVLEHEVQLGTKSLVFTGGTPHSMRHSFACVEAMDVVAVRRSAAGKMLRRMANWSFANSTFLGQVLSDEQLQWQ